MEPPADITYAVGERKSASDPLPVYIRGTNKQIVGQEAAKMRGLRPPEPYKGKGVKYKEERIRRKAGKAGKR
jgi:large subunit ribosomal protein L6